jgi:hypothetical protein
LKKDENGMFTILKNIKVRITNDKELRIKYKNQLNFFLFKIYKVRIKKIEKIIYTVGADFVRKASPDTIGKKIKNISLSVLMSIINM